MVRNNFPKKEYWKHWLFDFGVFAGFLVPASIAAVFLTLAMLSGLLYSAFVAPGWAVIPLLFMVALLAPVSVVLVFVGWNLAFERIVLDSEGFHYLTAFERVDADYDDVKLVRILTRQHFRAGFYNLLAISVVDKDGEPQQVNTQIVYAANELAREIKKRAPNAVIGSGISLKEGRKGFWRSFSIFQ
ncbi:MAG TPA: hypothetical protein VJI67_02105 [archaeon]|nr:hypothetical protein [archaeon]HLD81401.1 hypothetical protein [archaeon]